MLLRVMLRVRCSRSRVVKLSVSEERVRVIRLDCRCGCDCNSKARQGEVKVGNHCYYLRHTADSEARWCLAIRELNSILTRQSEAD
jgi:hypothetical protein